MGEVDKLSPTVGLNHFGFKIGSSGMEDDYVWRVWSLDSLGSSESVTQTEYI